MTADTITDAEIHMLLVWAHDLVTDCRTALGTGIVLRPTPAEIQRARARCAEILNARVKTEALPEIGDRL